MDTLSIPNPLHSLDDKWDLYYHLPQDNNWELSGYTVIINSIEHVEQLLELNAHIHDTIIRNCMLFVMRTGITPMWEDPNNRNGGCFSYKVSNKYF